MNSRKQGAIGVAKAVAYYGEQGFAVFIPISDITRYDLIVDTGTDRLRVEVKTTTAANGAVMLRTCGGNQSWGGVVKRISREDCDRVFIANLNTGTCKEFTSDELHGRSSIRVR